jgi:cytochrome c-type biogenesis protein CcmH/NrfG
LHHLRAARDLDTLRFRCDSRLNEVTRGLAAHRETERVRLADAERLLAGLSPGGVPGAEWFYDHVHLTFSGNYAVARAIVAEIESLLPERLGASATANSWPSIEECARRLAWTDWPLHAAFTDVLARLSEPPFTGQLNHTARVRSVTAMLQELSEATQSGGLDTARKSCETAIAAAPDDPWLRDELAALKELTDDLPGAETEARLAVRLLPSNGPAWSRLGQILARQQKFNEAIGAFQRALEWDTQDV